MLAKLSLNECFFFFFLYKLKNHDFMSSFCVIQLSEINHDCIIKLHHTLDALEWRDVASITFLCDILCILIHSYIQWKLFITRSLGPGHLFVTCISNILLYQ